MPGRFSFRPRRSGLNPRFIPEPIIQKKKQKSPIALCGNGVISPRKSGEVSGQSETHWVCPRRDRC